MSPQRLPKRRRPQSSHSIKTRETEAAKSSQTIDTVEFPVKKKKRSRAERIDSRKKQSNTNPKVVIAVIAVLGVGAYLVSNLTKPSDNGLEGEPVAGLNTPVVTPEKVVIPAQAAAKPGTNTLVPLGAPTKTATTNKRTPLQTLSSTPIPTPNNSKITVTTKSGSKPFTKIPGNMISSKIMVNAPGAILVIKNLDETNVDSTATDSNVSAPAGKSDNMVSSTIKGLFSFSSKEKRTEGTDGYLFDLPGKTIIPESSNDTEVVQLDSDQLIHESLLKFGNRYEITAYLDGQSTQVMNHHAVPSMSNSQKDGANQLNVEFSPEQLNGFQLSASCILKSDDSQSFSGFLFGNRKTIATSVRALTNPKIEKIQIIFNQGEANEKTITGAKLLHFDAMEDVALLELPEELEAGTPYFISAGIPEKEQSFVVVGEKTDAEKNSVETVDLQKFSLNQKINPIAIGGPVAKENSLQALGIVTSHLYKTNISELHNRDSQAIIIKLADVPFQFAMEMDANAKLAKQRELNSTYEENFDLLTAARTAERISNDGYLYSDFCLSMLGEFMAHVTEATIDVDEQAPTSVLIRLKKRAALEFKRKDGRKLAATLRGEMTPELQFQESAKQYDAILANANVDSRIKDALTRSFDIYKEIKKSSKTILKTSSSKDQKTDDEYLDWMTKLRKDLEMNCNDVVSSVNYAIMN